MRNNAKVLVPIEILRETKKDIHGDSIHPDGGRA